MAIGKDITVEKYSDWSKLEETLNDIEPTLNVLVDFCRFKKVPWHTYLSKEDSEDFLKLVAHYEGTIPDGIPTICSIPYAHVLIPLSKHKEFFAGLKKKDYIHNVEVKDQLYKSKGEYPIFL